MLQGLRGFQKGQKNKNWNGFQKEHKMTQIRHRSGEIFGFQKGQKAWNSGKKGLQTHTEEEKRKQSERMKGNKNPMYGRKNPQSKEAKRKNSEANKGKKRSKETRQKMGKKREKHWNWKGGISNNPYSKEFTSELKLKIRMRDNFVCVLCGRTEREELEELDRVLCVNHIDFDKKNCKESNLNTLCVRCNVKINRDREHWSDYFNTL